MREGHTKGKGVSGERRDLLIEGGEMEGANSACEGGKIAR